MDRIAEYLMNQLQISLEDTDDYVAPGGPNEETDFLYFDSDDQEFYVVTVRKARIEVDS